MRKTKILCTIGPVSESYDMLSKMVDAGMNAVRLNMSHGDHQSHEQVIKSVKTLNKKIKYPIPILLDTQGPEIRTGNLDRDLELKNGDVITVSVRAGNVEESSIHINYEDLIDTVSIDDIITATLEPVIAISILDCGIACEVMPIDKFLLVSRLFIQISHKHG